MSPLILFSRSLALYLGSQFKFPNLKPYLCCLAAATAVPSRHHGIQLLRHTSEFRFKNLQGILKSRFSSVLNLMEEQTIFHRMISHLHSTCKYYTGYPKDLGPSRVIHFSSEREFVQLLHQGHPVVVAFTIRGNYTKHLDKVLEEAAAEFYPHIKFMRVECPKYPGFCITRQRKEYPFIELFHSPEQASNQGKGTDPNITKYSVKVLPFNYDVSAYGFREFFKRHGISSKDPR